MVDRQGGAPMHIPLLDSLTLALLRLLEWTANLSLPLSDWSLHLVHPRVISSAPSSVAGAWEAWRASGRASWAAARAAALAIGCGTGLAPDVDHCHLHSTGSASALCSRGMSPGKARSLLISIVLCPPRWRSAPASPRRLQHPATATTPQPPPRRRSGSAGLTGRPELPCAHREYCCRCCLAARS
jgi:hypothetical protein